MKESLSTAKGDRLFSVPEAFDHSPRNSVFFDEAMREVFHWHVAKCPEFASFMNVKKFIGSGDFAPEAIPPVFVTIFKEFRLISVKKNEVKIELTSSGTGGRKSAIVLDDRSYRRILKIVDYIFGELGLVKRDESVNYLCFTYDPKIAKNVGTAFSDKILTGLTRRKSVYYSLQWNKEISDFQFDLETTGRKLLEFAEKGDPVRILGFPAYLWQVCDWLESKGRSLRLGGRSFIITGGGWKIHKDLEVTKEVFKKRAAGILGLPEANIRDSFGMVEHGIPYVDCEYGNLHVPIYARARVLDPETLDEVSPGNPGLLHLMTPYLTGYPSISLLTTDLATLKSDCPCGRRGNTMHILGRAGLARHKGCAITALEYLSR